MFLFITDVAVYSSYYCGLWQLILHLQEMPTLPLEPRTSRTWCHRHEGRSRPGKWWCSWSIRSRDFGRRPDPVPPARARESARSRWPGCKDPSCSRRWTRTGCQTLRQINSVLSWSFTLMKIKFWNYRYWLVKECKEKSHENDDGSRQRRDQQVSKSWYTFRQLFGIWRKLKAIG